jgi:hypothetical protein
MAPKMTRGERLNNPGNIRHVIGTTWLGQSAEQLDESFVTFDDPVFGFRAMTRIFLSYERRGIDTLSEAIDRWAPPNENNSQAYIEDVCEHCAISSDASVSLTSIMPQLNKAVTWHEQGGCIYSDDQITQGIALAESP